MLRLLPLFTLVPLVDLMLLVWIGDRLGVWPALALVVGTGLAGAALAKREGLRVIRSFRQAAAERRLPEEGVLSGVLVIVGAALLVAPGVITDAVGLLLLIPPTRRAIAALVRARLARRVGIAAVGRRPARDRTIEVERRR